MSNELQKVFDYSFVPTVKKMRKDNRKIRIVMGPVGSGKSSGCMVELVSRAMEQKPNSIGERRSRWAIVRNCYDDQTEILTEKRGWQLFKDLDETDRVGTLHGDELVFEYPTYFYQAEHVGEMVHLESENVDFCVTPDHKLYSSVVNGCNKTRSPFRLEFARDAYGKTNREFKIQVGSWKGWADTHGLYPEDRAVAIFEFLGLWFSEGSLHRKTLCISQKKYREYVVDVLTRCGFDYSVSDKGGGNCNYRFRLNDISRRWMDELRPCGGSLDKWVPSWIKNATKEQLNAFLHAYIVGDGHYRTNGHDTTRISTGSSRMAADLQEMAFRAGFATTVTKSGKEWKVTFLTGERSSPKPQKKHWSKCQYEGMVYCVEVSTHLIVTRRNGKISINSQTYRQLEDSTILTFLNWFPSPIAGKYTQDDHTYRMDRLLPDGTRLNAEFRFRSLDRPDDVSNLLSTEYTGAYFNELREISKYIFDNMDSRIPRFPPHGEEGATWYGIVADTNPPDTDHWLWKLAEEKIPSDPILQGKYKIFQQPSGLSPEAENIPNLVPGYYQDIMIGKDPEWIKVYVMGEYGYVGTGQPVYRNYSDSVHCAKEPIKPMAGVPLILGFDAGLMPAVVICQMIPQGQFRILHEFPGQDLGMRKLLKDYVKPFLFTNYQGFAIVASGDVPKRAETDEGTTYGEFRDILGVSPRKPRSNALAPRIGAIDLLLTSTCYNGQPKFQLSPNCRMLRKGFISEYRRERVQVVGMDRMKDIPEKNDYSHIMEAAQYAALYAEKGIAMTSEQYQQAQQPVRIAPPVGAYA